LEAFAYLHDNGIAHRDVKLENVLVGVGKDPSNPIIKLIDFGFSCRCTLNKSPPAVLAELKENKRDQSHRNSKSEVEEDIFYDYCGTRAYISPEVNSKKGYRARPSDVWALGVLLFFMVTGHFPFRSVTEKSEFEASVLQEVEVKLSQPLVMMLKKMMQNSPGMRPGVRELLGKEEWMGLG
jgi:serine/threonine protein kinase